MAHRVAERLDDLGIPRTMIHFRTVRGTATLYLVPFLALVISVPGAILYPLIGLIAATVFAILAVLEATNRPLLSRLLALDPSQNVIGLIPNQAPAQPDDEPQRRVILTAHLDSPRKGWLDRPPLASASRGLTVLTLLSILAIPVALSVNLFVNSNIALIAAVAPGLFVFLALMLLLQRDIAGDLDSGLNDNGSGVTLAMSIAEEFQRYPPMAVEVLLVFTGAAHAGATGMTNFLTANRFNRETTYVVNLESVGEDPISFTRAEGPVLALRSSPALVQIAGDIALSNAERLMRPVIHRGTPTDQYSALIRGYQAITIMGYSDPRPMTAPAESGLQSEVQPEALENAFLLTYGIIRRLDDELATASRTQSE